MKLSPVQKEVLLALADGTTLKSHRFLDGRKVYQLHPLEGEPQPVRPATVEALRERRLIDSNKKFPAATYLLTEKGRQVTEALIEGAVRPLSARDYLEE